MFDTQGRPRDQILIWLLCHIQKEWVDETARPRQQHICICKFPLEICSNVGCSKKTFALTSNETFVQA